MGAGDGIEVSDLAGLTRGLAGCVALTVAAPGDVPEQRLERVERQVEVALRPALDPVMEVIRDDRPVEVLHLPDGGVDRRVPVVLLARQRLDELDAQFVLTRAERVGCVLGVTLLHHPLHHAEVPALTADVGTLAQLGDRAGERHLVELGVLQQVAKQHTNLQTAESELGLGPAGQEVLLELRLLHLVHVQGRHQSVGVGDGLGDFDVRQCRASGGEGLCQGSAQGVELISQGVLLGQVVGGVVFGHGNLSFYSVVRIPSFVSITAKLSTRRIPRCTCRCVLPSLCGGADTLAQYAPTTTSRVVVGRFLEQNLPETVCACRYSCDIGVGSQMMARSSLLGLLTGERAFGYCLRLKQGYEPPLFFTVSRSWRI